MLMKRIFRDNSRNSVKFTILVTEVRILKQIYRVLERTTNFGPNYGDM